MDSQDQVVFYCPFGMSFSSPFLGFFFLLRVLCAPHFRYTSPPVRKCFGYLETRASLCFIKHRKRDPVIARIHTLFIHRLLQANARRRQPRQPAHGRQREPYPIGQPLHPRYLVNQSHLSSTVLRPFGGSCPPGLSGYGFLGALLRCLSEVPFTSRRVAG